MFFLSEIQPQRYKKIYSIAPQNSFFLIDLGNYRCYKSPKLKKTDRNGGLSNRLGWHLWQISDKVHFEKAKETFQETG
jgi:hypothetical protein